MKIKLNQRTGTGIVVLMVAAVFIAATIFPSTVGASPWSDAREKRGGFPGKGRHRTALGIWQNQQVIDELEFTREQVQQIRDADFASREKRLELKTRFEQLRLQMDKAFSREVSDQEAVRQLAQKAAGIQGQMFVLHIEDRLTVETILTSDQIRKLELKTMHRKRGGRGSGKPSGAKAHLAGKVGC